MAVVECSDGIPDHGNYKSLLNNAGSIQEALHDITTSETTHVEQWIVQMQAATQQWADVYVYSALPPDEVTKCHTVLSIY